MDIKKQPSKGDGGFTFNRALEAKRERSRAWKEVKHDFMTGYYRGRAFEILRKLTVNEIYGELSALYGDLDPETRTKLGKACMAFVDALEFIDRDISELRKGKK